MDLVLRDECKTLLTKLKSSQKSFKEKLQQSSKQLDIPSHNFEDHSDETKSFSNFGKDITGQVNVSKDAETDLKPTYARNKLLSLCKSSSSNDKDEILDMNTTYLKDKENCQTSESFGHHAFDFDDIYSNVKHLHPSSTNTNSFNHNLDGTSHHIPSTTPAWKKRQLIDKHIAVDTKLNPKELKELDDERLLNFNYSNINVDKSYDIKSLKSLEDINNSEQMKEKQTNPVMADSSGSTVSFQDQLQDEGNDRRFKNWVKEAANKPKTMLNSTDYYSLARRGINSRAKSNLSGSGDASMIDQRMMGYDWIAALLDNEQNMVDQSESFFDELCDFRKAFKGECNNQFYNESPYTLVDREPEPVVEALTEPKVRPFVVNERLFTEPLTSDLIEDNCSKNGKKSNLKEPTKDNPRFVRVSIPRSTLQTPHRVKPHRRGSFDGSDSCSLIDHCLLGWENTVPSSIPPAKSLSLASDAGTQVNSQTTTLAEAERLATVHNQAQWHLSRPASHSQVLPRWRKHYMDTTLNLTLPSSTQQQQQRSTNASTTLNQSSGGGDVKRRTDKILQATYSTMYEMERLRQQRELETTTTLNQSSAASSGGGDVKRRIDRILQDIYSTMYEIEPL